MKTRNPLGKPFVWLLLAAIVLFSGLSAASNPFTDPPEPAQTLAAVTRATQALHTGIPVPVEVVPEPAQVKATNLVTYFLDTFHYHKVPLNDALSEKILERYLNSLDPNHSFFLADDIETFETYRTRLDDQLEQADLSVAFAIFNVYLARVEERADYALKLVEKDFDFTLEETYQLDRSEMSWPDSVASANELWRKRIKNDILQLKLADKESDKLRETLHKRYASLADRVSELDHQDAFQLFMNAYAGAVEPHTSYLAPRTSENFEIAMSLSLEGIGAVLQSDFEYTKIRRIVAGGPADKDGRLQADDRIVGVAQGKDGEMVDVVGWRLDDVVQLIRGPKDSVVRLAILPAGASPSDPTQIVQITRNQVKLEEQSAEQSIIEIDLGEDNYQIGVIEIPTFYIDFAARARGDDNYRSTTRDVHKLLDQLKEENVDGLIIDLRGNGGGSLVEAIDMTGLFIDEGPVVQVRSASGKINVERDSDEGRAWNGPLAVMVDRYSASASEIFAAAIQDYGRGVVIGESTYGKGTVQNLIDLDQFNSDDDLGRLGKLKITTAQFFRVNGSSTQMRGVVPDIPFATTVVAEKTGESSHENALPWSAIEATEYDPAHRLEDVLAQAAAMHATRVEDNEKFQSLIDEINRYYQEQDDTVVSLNLAKRKLEYQQAQENSDERFAQTDEDAAAAEEEEEQEDDVLLNEAARILTDIVRLKGSDVGMKAAAIDKTLKDTGT